MCVDSGFLIALYDNRDDHHESAEKHFVQRFDAAENILVIPWPILYESISSRLVRRRDRIAKLKSDWHRLQNRGQLHLLDDETYRHRSLDDCFDETEKEESHYWGLSLADRVIRNILQDPQVDVAALITFDVGDFVDVCRRKDIEILSRD